VRYDPDVLVARGSAELRNARLELTNVFARGAWASIVRRRGMTFDTRFAPNVRGPAAKKTCLLLLRSGTFVARDASGLHVEGPAVVRVTECDLEGGDGGRAWTFRNAGEPFELVEVHVAEERASGAAPESVAVGPEAWRAVDRVLDAAGARADDARIGEGMRSLLEALSAEGLVTRRIVELAASPVPFERLWGAVRPLAERFAVSATHDQLVDLAQASPRQLDRWLQSFFATFGMIGGGWRPTTVHLRLKVAVLFLSVEGATMAEVARVAGYGSVEAMARAFRDAKLPAPSEVAARLRSAQ
jgi:AraC-like DNA-binding protein